MNSKIFLLPLLLLTTLFSFSKTNVKNDEVVLKQQQGWTIDTIAPGYIWYNYSNYYRPQNAYQNVNILEVDFSRPEYTLDIVYVSPTDSTSSVAKKAGAIGGINGSYELDATFVKTKNNINSQVTLQPGDLRFWKHEGAIFFNRDTKQADISFGTNASYLANSFPNILSGAPMLIDNFSPVGETFTGDVSGINLNSLEYEDYRRHQGVRHPRTAVALTEGGKMLLIVADGRRKGAAEGMSAKELTQFLVYYFNPQKALNIDGGGSSTMYIKGSNLAVTDVVNYPTDNDKADHYGQRSVRTFILVKKTDQEAETLAGDGTVSSPYLIATPAHLQLMHSLNYATPLYFKLIADINMSLESWQPLNSADPYTKNINFDGNGHVIKNLTVKGSAYASLFGVLCGSCKNLGVINATIESSNSGGIIAGYVGLKAPTSTTFTGKIENCYTTGTVTGTDGVGGIVGNVGKPIGSVASSVINSYSTATVTSRNTTGNSRSGGIVGILWDRGVLENCYATGTVVSSSNGAGGIVGWADTDIKGCVARNDTVINKVTGQIGRIAGKMGSISGVIAQGVNCWGYEGVVLNNAGYILPPNELATGQVMTKETSYDGASKSLAYLSDPMSYFSELNWDFASDNNVWAQTMSNGYPIFQWLFNRSDHATINGIPSSLKENKTLPIRIALIDNKISINSDVLISSVDIYAITGQKVYSNRKLNTNAVQVGIDKTGILIVLVVADGQQQVFKVSNK